MPTVVMERLDEVATAWRRGLDADELTNPAGPLFSGDEYTEYDITATGGGDTTYTMWTGNTWMNDPGETCICCL